MEKQLNLSVCVFDSDSQKGKIFCNLAQLPHCLNMKMKVNLVSKV